MDYSGSEILDSLDILRPRVKRLCENRSQKTVSSPRRYLNTFRDDSKVTGHSISANIGRAAASSTSLVLKKTSQREILEKYSVVSYTSLLRANRHPSSEISLSTRDKPLIKVTVIPKSTQVPTNKHRRQSPTTKKIQNTVSNHENSIHTKNLYLVVAGRKKDKVYEIKTTGSAKFSAETRQHRNHDEDNLIKERSSIKQIIQSLNMDKKKKKGKFRKDNKKFSANFVPEGVDSHHDCRCIRDGRNVDGRKSRVRIFGQVGLNDDERYVLKCDATVDGEPIMTKIISEKPGPSQYNVNDVIEQIKYRNSYDTMACFGGYCQNDNYSKSLRDSNIQVDLIENNQIVNSDRFRSVENQGTQVNFSLCPTNHTSFTPKRNQTIQCNYATVPNTLNIIEDESARNIVKETQSPLVIISVYPKQELNEAKSTKKSVFTNTRPISPRSPTNVRNKNIGRNERYRRDFDKLNDTSPKPSRSPSPKRKNVNDQQKREDIYQTDTKLPRSRTNSPNRLATFSYKARMTSNNDRIQTNSSPKITDESDVFTAKNMLKINNILMSRGNKTNSEIKKALVDDYTRQITETLDKYADISPGHETSKVKINIDSENEYYDVKLAQGRRTTDLQIRKTLKDAALQNREYTQCSLSPENLYLLPEKEHARKSVSPFKNVRKSNDPKSIKIRNSNLNVRDSIEISHKREAGPSKKVAQTHKSTKQSECCRDTDFLAPIKHYKGDSCELPDPIERDKQIRQLLGIVKGKANIKQNDVYGGVVGDHGLFDCFYKRDREKTLEKAVSPHDNCGCKSTFSNPNHKLKTITDHTKSAVERTSLYQQLILNRNIQVFLQVEQFTKQKPIILSRKQYDKVKRTIQRTISRKISQEKRKKTCKCSLISLGEVRKRTKNELPLTQESNKQTQTDEHKFEHTERFDGGEPVGLKISTKRKLRIDDSASEFPYGPKKASQVKTIVLFDSKARNNEKEIENINDPLRETNSSLEIHYATVGYMRKVTFSSTNVGSLSSSSMIRRNDSLYTIFKGRKRSATPNLGTSELSLPHIEVNSGSAKGFMNPIDSKPKKPFLRRLMSCLVMRSKTSDIKIAGQPHPVPTSVNSSIDSYQFSTSLGAIPMGSSLYDTTASFYTSHSVLPIVNSKMKRGFFSSVREFLTNRKSC